ncbi:hypothetical protein TcCL_Unassigned04586 [Trypanosoma cruzi]|nr:hypothetical protein TcCL_Unassigned04586 [Trypanosoma cruzi]
MGNGCSAHCGGSTPLASWNLVERNVLSDGVRWSIPCPVYITVFFFLFYLIVASKDADHSATTALHTVRGPAAAEPERLPLLVCVHECGVNSLLGCASMLSALSQAVIPNCVLRLHSLNEPRRGFN